MTNPDQFPERLIAFRTKRSPSSLAGGPTFAAEEQRPGDRPTCAEEREYIRADVATEQAAAALRGEAHEVAALRAEVEALRAKNGRMERALESIATGGAASQYEAEEALSDCEKLAALRPGEFVRTITAERNAYREALEKVVALMAPAQVWEPWAAKEVAKAALAVKP